MKNPVLILPDDPMDRLGDLQIRCMITEKILVNYHLSVFPSDFAINPHIVF